MFEARDKGLPTGIAKTLGDIISDARGTSDPFTEAAQKRLGEGPAGPDSSIGDKVLQAGMMAGAAMTGGDISTDGTGSALGIPGGKCESCGGSRWAQGAYIAATVGMLVGGSAYQGYRAIAATRSELMLVSRWGLPGLQKGDWVMPGLPTKTNYFFSFKWQPGVGNQFSPYSAGEVFAVPRASVGWPRGAGLDGRFKGLFGQRRYMQ